MVHAVRRKYSCLNNIVQIFSNEQEDDTKTLQLHSDTELCLWSEPPSCLRRRWCSVAPCPRPAQYPSLFVGTLGCKCRQWWRATSARQHQSLPHCQHCRVHCPAHSSQLTGLLSALLYPPPITCPAPAICLIKWETEKCLQSISADQVSAGCISSHIPYIVILHPTQSLYTRH